MFKDCSSFETEVAGRLLKVQTGGLAEFANGSCYVSYGDTCVLATVTMSDEDRLGIDFLPLSVDFEERFYSVGKIPGSFIKREAKPSEKAILSARLIDRSIRPLFPSGLTRDILLTCTVLSVDAQCPVEIVALIASSIALSISDIPWNGPISGTNVGYDGSKFIINPTEEQRKSSNLNLVISSTFRKILMIEAGAHIVSENIVYSGLEQAFDVNYNVIKFIENIQKSVGKVKQNFEVKNDDDFLNFKNLVIESSKDELESALNNTKKDLRDLAAKIVREKAVCTFSEKFPEHIDKIEKIFYELQKKIVRNWILNNSKRVDGRGLNEIRDLSADVSMIPRTHGSALFKRGQTQVLTLVTLGPLSDQQTIDDLTSEESKRFIHHYNFPSFSVGETRSSRAPARREIGHGSLVEKALLPIIPSIDDFPYTIRLVSEVLSSNGSTSQASVCSSTIALMDAGINIKSPVAGISCGLVQENELWKTIVDIQGIEDFFGDMDFKVAGTKDGITAIQLDIKNDGITFEIISEVFKKAKEARIKIIDEVILNTISAPRKDLSVYAPKVLMTTIPIDKIRDLIGTGGKVVQNITNLFDVKVDIEQDGKVFVMSKNLNSCKDAIQMIHNIVKDIVPGDVFRAKAVRITEFGAFFEFAPGREGLCHISNLTSGKKPDKVSDLIKIGDELTVSVIGLDDRGRVNFKVISLIPNI